MSEELNVVVRIRDRQFIIANINRSVQTEAAFKSYLYPEVAFLQHVGESGLANSIPRQDQRALFVFLQQELARRGSNADLINSVTDSLILWALEGTDPQKGIVLSRDLILQKIEAILPTARSFVRGNLNHRLDKLSSKNGEMGREIQFHSKLNGFCLPYATRQLVEVENAEDAVLKDIVSGIFEANAEQVLGELSPDLVALVVQICHRVVEKAFYSQGLEVAAFISDGGASADNQFTLADCVDEALDETPGVGANSASVKAAALSVLRKAFYESTPQERDLPGDSRTS